MTVVGTVEYDVRLNLGQLKKDTSQAEKIVNDSYKKMSQAQRRSTTGGSTSGAKTQAEEITRVTQAQVEATKKAAQESYNAISTYTPQIQRQFLSVERANNQVYNASTRSAQAIQKYGADSVQATRATNALNVAVQNQSIAQNRLDNSLKSTGNNLTVSRGGVIALTAAVAALGLAIGANLQGAISRSDTLNNFPLVMSNLKISTDESQEAITLLSDRLKGLPTSLNAAAQSVQRLTAVNGNVKASSALFLGLNNAIIAGGTSAMIQQTAIEQLSQAYSKGKLDMIEWRALLTAMPAQLEQVAQAMGMVNADALGESLRTGKVSIDDFLLTISRLNAEGANGFASFEEQARNATGGVETSIATLNTAIQRSIATIIDSIGRDNIRSSLDSIGNSFESTARLVGNLINIISPLAPVLTGAAIGLGIYTTATTAATLATRVFGAALTFISKHPVIAILAALAAVIGGVTAALGGMSNEIEDTTAVSDDLTASLEGYEPPIRGASDAAKEFAKQMAKIDEQIAKANEDYRYNLAQLVADKNKNIAQLQSTLSEEEKAYNNAYAERLASFDKTQNEEELKHSEKTRALQNQIDFLTRYNTAANQRRVSELQFELARENSEYQKSTQLRQNEFQKQTQSAATEYEKRRAENQKKLNEELALLNKHREDVLGIRNVILLDEIESLRKSRNEQIKSLEQQKNDIVNTLTTAGSTAGTNSAKAFNKAFGEQGIYFDTPTKYSVSRESDGKLYVKPDYADGGFTGRGGKYDEAGIVHKGEYVLPKEMVNQATGLPKEGALSSGGTTVNVAVNMSGVMASGNADLRAIGVKIGKVINETVMAKTGKVGIQGI